MKRWLLTSATVGLFTPAVGYAIVFTTEQFHSLTAQLWVRYIALLIWPTGLFLLANEGATSAVEVASNFAKAVGSNVLLYSLIGSLLFALRSVGRKLAHGGTREV